MAIAVEVRGAGMGRVRLARVPYAGKAALHPFVADAVEPGATLHTDAWKGYDNIEQLGYARIATNLSASGDPAHVHMPRVHRIASLLKRWWIGTHQGAIRRRHLDFTSMSSRSASTGVGRPPEASSSIGSSSRPWRSITRLTPTSSVGRRRSWPASGGPVPPRATPPAASPSRCRSGRRHRPAVAGRATVWRCPGRPR